MDRFHHDNESCGRGHRGPADGLHAFMRGGHGSGGFRPPFGPFGGHGGGRARRGDVRTAVLRLLAEQPMHGYQIIQELSSRSGGAWSPSAGSVYPTLQLLADEGLVTSEESAGKKVFSLTEAGKAAVAEVAEQPAPWDEAAEGDASGGLRGQMPQIGAAIWQIAQTRDADKIARAVAILSDTRKQLYAILSED